MNSCLQNFDPMASAMAYGQKPKVVRAKQSAMVEGENCTYSPTLQNWLNVKCFSKDEKLVLKTVLPLPTLSTEFLFLNLKRLFSSGTQKSKSILDLSSANVSVCTLLQ